MTQVVFPTLLGGDGATWSDDGTGTKDLTNGGHRTYFIPLMSQALAMANSAKTSANSAIGSANLTGTSTTSLSAPTIGSDVTLTTQSGKTWATGNTVIVADSTAPYTRWISGVVKSYATTTLVVTVNDFSGATWPGASWSVSPTGFARASAMTPSTVSATGSTALAASDRGKVIRGAATGAMTFTFPAASTLGAGWFVYVQNVTAVASGYAITLDPNASELIDGQTTVVMYANEMRLVTCDGTAFTSLVMHPGSAMFTSTGTWTKPTGYNLFRVRVQGAGGGGGGGTGSGTLTNRGGGGGAGGGAYVEIELFASQLSSTETATIGAGGTSGAGGNGASGSAGGAGGSSSFKWVTGYGGSAGAAGLLGGGVAVGGNGGAPVSNPPTAMASLVYGVGATTSSSSGTSGLASGGGGANDQPGGGTSGSGGASLYGGAGGGAGASISGSGTSGTAGSGGTSVYGGSAGAGGGIGAAGTAGLSYGGGGGGGGASTTIGGAGAVGFGGSVIIEGIC